MRSTPATAPRLKSLETSFHQDLNGDGTIGVPSTVIEAAGSTSLIQADNNFYLNNIGSGTGPTLKYGGTAVTVGQFDPYVPVAVEQTAGGYQVALKYAAGNRSRSGIPTAMATSPPLLFTPATAPH